MSYKTATWQVIVYDKDENQIAEWLIEDRTEGEAVREAEYDVHHTPDSEDWTMTEVEKEQSL